MNKQELIAKTSERTGISQKDVSDVLKPALEIITEALLTGEPVQITGFGTFYTKELRERIGINPQTKEKISIPSQRVIKFRGSPKIDLNLKDEESK